MKLTGSFGSVSVAGSGIMTSSHPITASTPEGSSYGAIGTVSSRTGDGGRALPGAGGGADLQSFDALRPEGNKVTSYFSSCLQVL